MATLALAILTSKPNSSGKYPIYIRISVKNKKDYIKTEYHIDDLSQWYNGKVVSRHDSAMMNKRLLFELKKYKDRLQYIENFECYTSKQLKAILTQQDKVSPNISTFNDFMRQRIKEKKGRR